MSKSEYQAGQQSVWLDLLRMVIANLPESDQESYRLERLETITWLRTYCAEHGDNNWDDNIHLVDIINKHLLNSLIYTSLQFNADNALLKDKDAEIERLKARNQFLEAVAEQMKDATKLDIQENLNYQYSLYWDFCTASHNITIPPKRELALWLEERRNQ